jgi:hypothetical protein
MGFLKLALGVPLSLIMVTNVVIPLILRANVQFGSVPESTQNLVDDWLASHEGSERGPSGQFDRPLTQEEMDSYKRDGFLVVRNAIDPSTVEVLRTLIDYWLDRPNLPNKISQLLNCQVCCWEGAGRGEIGVCV